MSSPTSPSPIAALAPHPHHWVIEPPGGAFSVGRCKLCGVERSFSNSSEATTWAREGEADTEIVQLRREIARRRPDFRLSDEAA